MFAHEEPVKQARKRVRIEDLEDSEDEIRIFKSQKASETTNSPSKPKMARPKRPKKKDIEPSSANKAAVQLMKEAKICLTLDQICDLAPSFRTEVRRLLVKPRKPKESISKEQISGLANTTINSSENMYFSNNSGGDSVCCPRTLVKVNDLYEVNTLLDGGAVPDIITLDLVKRL